MTWVRAAGGKGFKFDEAEQAKLKEAAARNRKMLLLENGEEVSEEEEDEAEKAMEEDFEEQATNLNTQHAQKVAEYTAKTVEAESNKVSRGRGERGRIGRGRGRDRGEGNRGCC